MKEPKALTKQGGGARREGGLLGGHHGHIGAAKGVGCSAMSCRAHPESLWIAFGGKSPSGLVRARDWGSWRGIVDRGLERASSPAPRRSCSFKEVASPSRLSLAASRSREGSRSSGRLWTELSGEGQAQLRASRKAAMMVIDASALAVLEVRRLIVVKVMHAHVVVVGRSISVTASA